ncbi:class IIb bacteriocin, lactobin A/cerein 7B family [Chryseobacterium fistulae]|uniref:Class IIb bacteriocin, lactobin A/cerein 7B family n=1 Tax=Chryseobacterium fistulae TaxID=2675058 RepID=A0A6N4XV73_9FLAO|nr:class IIb bacteriocin, lactobin A/cerein 7B family [Chryseobacterium fistulae]CAA7393278.1 hypothetical protein CHRY9393_03491 [Chryseobacterium fistulae]
MQIENLKVQELNSQEVKNVEGGFFPVAIPAMALGGIAAKATIGFAGAVATGFAGWGVSRVLNRYWR